jgi:CheY-like chemotaxis protein
VRKIRILLVEDNEPDAYLVEEALRRAGLDYQLDVFVHADAAMRHIDAMKQPGSESCCPDVLILDLNLPGASGQDLLERFRVDYRDVPVIVFTSSEAPADRNRAFAAGASRYVRKPSELSEFLEIGNLVKDVVGGLAPPSAEHG